MKFLTKKNTHNVTSFTSKNLQSTANKICIQMSPKNELKNHSKNSRKAIKFHKSKAQGIADVD
jgi:hypothetical protein